MHEAQFRIKTAMMTRNVTNIAVGEGRGERREGGFVRGGTTTGGRASLFRSHVTYAVRTFVLLSLHVSRPILLLRVRGVTAAASAS